MTSIIFAHKTGSAYTVKILSFIRSSCPEVLRSAILLKKETLAQVFSYEFCQISRNTFFKGLPLAASVLW